MRRPRKAEKVLRPVHPNAGMQAAYRGKLDNLIRRMGADYERRLRAAYARNPPEMAQDASSRRVTAVEVQIGQRGRGWMVYVDGTLVRGSNGVARYFKSQDTAEAAGLKAAGPSAELTIPQLWGARHVPFGELPLVRAPAAEIQATLESLGADWTARLEAGAPKLADWFARSVRTRSATQLRTILRDAGISVEFQMTPAMRDVFHATVAENVGLIKSIGSQYHSQVQTMVMQSVQAGRDLSSLTDALEDRYGITRRRAAFIARDQNNKATAVFTRVRQEEVGITEAIWLHSHGGKEPRKTHLANNGKRYNITEGWFDPDPKVRKKIWPGELINCRCVSKPIVKGFS